MQHLEQVLTLDLNGFVSKERLSSSGGSVSVLFRFCAAERLNAVSAGSVSLDSGFD